MDEDQDVEIDRQASEPEVDELNVEQDLTEGDNDEEEEDAGLRTGPGGGWSGSSHIDTNTNAAVGPSSIVSPATRAFRASDGSGLTIPRMRAGTSSNANAIARALPAVEETPTKPRTRGTGRRRQQ
jgi:hypothetical protein